MKNKIFIILLFVVCILITGCAFNKAVTKKVGEIKTKQVIRVPYAIKTITPQTEITNDMIAMKTVEVDTINQDEIYTASKDILGKYTGISSTIAIGSFFYKKDLMDKEDLATLLEGHAVAISIKSGTSYTFVAGDYFDIYVSITENTGTVGQKTMVGKLFEKNTVFSVKTADGTTINYPTEGKIPAALITTLSEENYTIYKKAEYCNELGVDIEFVPVPTGLVYSQQSTTASEELLNYINEKTKNIDIKKILDY